MQVELFAPSNQPDKLMPLAHGDNKHVPLLLLLQQEQEWVAEDTVGMLCQEQEQEQENRRSDLASPVEELRGRPHGVAATPASDREPARQKRH